MRMNFLPFTMNFTYFLLLIIDGRGILLPVLRFLDQDIKWRFIHSMDKCTCLEVLFPNAYAHKPGEFSSPKGNTFYHYSDLHQLNPQTRQFTKIQTSGPCPSARSGHRMIFWRHLLLLFGGFHDTSSVTKYHRVSPFRPIYRYTYSLQINFGSRGNF